MSTEALRVYFDGSCRFCTAEIAALRGVAPDGALLFIDCSVPAFNDSLATLQGISTAAMMQALHVRDATGNWYQGVDAFTQLYGRAGLPQLARFWAHPVSGGLMRRLYPWIVRNRYWLSRLGLPALTEAVIRFYAVRAQRNSKRCAHGSCPIE